VGGVRGDGDRLARPRGALGARPRARPPRAGTRSRSARSSRTRSVPRRTARRVAAASWRLASR
jgi:hypothetical protein